MEILKEKNTNIFLNTGIVQIDL